MKLLYMTAALAALLAAPAFAGDQPTLSVADAAEQLAVQKADLRMVLGGAWSEPGRYPMNYRFAKRNFEQAKQRLRDAGVEVVVQGDRIILVDVSDADARLLAKTE